METIGVTIPGHLEKYTVPLDKWGDTFLEKVSSKVIFVPAAISEKPITHFSYQEINGGLSSFVVESYQKPTDKTLEVQIYPVFISGTPAENIDYGEKGFVLTDANGKKHEAKIVDGIATFPNVEKTQYSVGWELLSQPVTHESPQEIQKSHHVVFHAPEKQARVDLGKVPGMNLIRDTAKQLGQLATQAVFFHRG